MQLSKPQQTISENPSRFRVISAGRRFGKSFLAINELAKFARMPGKKVLAVANTYRQIKQTIWDDLKAQLFAVNWIKRVNESDLHIELINGSKIYLRSADNKDALRGAKYDFIVMDECADIDPETWYSVLRPTLSDSKGHAMFIGSPKGRNWFYDIWQSCDSLDDWQKFQYTTIEGGNVDEEEIEAAKRDTDERTFQQEYMAEWVDYSGVIYYNFSERNIVDIAQPVTPQTTLHVGIDFNVDPGVMAIAHKTPTGIHVFDEIEMFGTNTNEMVRELHTRYPRYNVICYPDAAGSQRKTSAGGVTDHIILKNAGYTLKVGSTNPAVKDRIASVNSAFCSASNETRLTISPKCRKIIECLRKHTYKEGTRQPDKGQFDHFNDALGYMVNHLYPLNVIRPQSVNAGRRRTGRY
jgi:phage terminase large subunit